MTDQTTPQPADPSKQLGGLGDVPITEVPEDEVELDTDREPLRPTDEDIEDGNHLGLAIKIDDDTDSGARETYQ